MRFEFECYDVGHLYHLAHFAERKLIEPPFLVQSVFGILGGIGTHPEDVMHMRRTAERLFGADCRWSVLGAGRMQWPIVAMAAAMGAHVRVGLEGSLWTGKGQLARSNAEPVRRVRSIVEGLGLAPATPDEARDILHFSKGLTRCPSDARPSVLLSVRIQPLDPCRLPIALAPAVKRLEHRAERLPLVCQKIFVARRVVLVEAGADHALVLEPFQPRRQRVRRDSWKPVFKFLEAQRALAEQVAQNEQRPLLANHIERPRHRAVLLAVSVCHGR
jgi:beta-keto acid cleavage enzyme